jgi:DNA primase
VPEGDHVIVVEGFFSVIRLYKLGIENAVALMGTALSTHQEELLAARFGFVTLLLDGDSPGRTAAEEVVSRLARRLFVRDAVLPDGTEPDTVAEDILRSLLKEAVR